MAAETGLADRLTKLVSTVQGERAPPSAVVEAVLRAAARSRASDVHFEPVERGLEVRFRLDGVLAPVACLPPELAPLVIARLKVLAGLATYRTDVPQDGRIPGDEVIGSVGGRAGEGDSGSGGRSEGGSEGGTGGKSTSGRARGTDLRLATYPTVRGEKAVVRLFAARPEDFTLSRLGLGDDVCARLVEALSGREGLVVLTGPAGSGKTTTIYAAIQHVRDDEAARRHIVTIEDPAECLLPGVTQTETNPPAGLTFANCLRSILRQDPEVIMVGEVRDAETASLAIEAALTGHLVITTLHAGTAAGVVSRLLEMGVEPYLVTSVLRAALAQRLVRRLCPECRGEGIATEVTEGTEGNGSGPKSSVSSVSSVARPFRAPGCESCLGTGFRGRVPIAEILALTPELRRAVLARADLDELERAARETGMVGMAARGEELVASGETTSSEVERALAGSRK